MTTSSPENGPEGPQGRLEWGPATPAPQGTQKGPQAGTDSLGLREVIVGAIWDTPSTHPDGIADAVYARLKPRLAPHYQRAVDAAVAAEQRAEIAEKRLLLAHQARRAKEHQLDDIRRALCDIGFMADDDPYSHADLADVIRQNGQALRDLAQASPAHNAGPSVREAAADDRRWWTDKYAGEGQ